MENSTNTLPGAVASPVAPVVASPPAPPMPPQPPRPFRSSESILKILPALIRARGEMETPKKSKTAQVRPREAAPYSYKYADIGDIVDCSTAVLCKNEIFATSCIRTGDRMLSLVTTLLHSSGEWFATDYEIAKGLKPQEFGSQQTYGRRYNLSMLLNLAAQEDDDGLLAQNGEAPHDGVAPEGKGPQGEPPAKPKGASAKASSGKPAVKPKGEDKDPKTPTPFMLVWSRLITDLKKTEKGAGAYVATVTGKTSSKDLSAEDIAKLNKQIDEDLVESGGESSAESGTFADYSRPSVG